MCEKCGLKCFQRRFVLLTYYMHISLKDLVREAPRVLQKRISIRLGLAEADRSLHGVSEIIGPDSGTDPREREEVSHGVGGRVAYQAGAIPHVTGSKHRQHEIRSRFPAPFGESLTKTGIAPGNMPLRREIEEAANAEHCVTNTALCFLAHPRPLSLQHIIEEFARKGQVLAHIPNPRSDRLKHHAPVGFGGGSHHPSRKSLVEPPHSTIKRFDRIVEPSRKDDGISSKARRNNCRRLVRCCGGDRLRLGGFKNKAGQGGEQPRSNSQSGCYFQNDHLVQFSVTAAIPLAQAMPSGKYDYGPCWIVRWCNGLRRKGRCEQQSCDYWRHHPVVESSTARRTVVIPARQVASWTISEIFIHNASLILRTGGNFVIT